MHSRPTDLCWRAWVSEQVRRWRRRLRWRFAFVVDNANRSRRGRLRRRVPGCAPVIHRPFPNRPPPPVSDPLRPAGTRRTVGTSRGNAARRDGKPEGQASGTLQDQGPGETFGNRPGSGSSKTGRKSGPPVIHDLQTAATARKLGERAMRPGDRKHRPLARLGPGGRRRPFPANIDLHPLAPYTGRPRLAGL